MAIDVNSTPVPARPLLPLSGAFAPEGLLRGYDAELKPDAYSGLALRGAAPRQSELLDILNAGPIAPADLAHLSRQKQKRAEAGIAALIDLLDALDGDPDLEDGGDTEPNCGDFGTYGANDECEGDYADDEPNLGAPEHMMSCGPEWWRTVDRICDQTHWAKGCGDDREVECEDEGACIQSQPHDPEPDEHSLGSLDRMVDQTRWAEVGTDGWGMGDLELEDEHGSDVMEGEAVYA